MLRVRALGLVSLLFCVWGFNGQGDGLRHIPEILYLISLTTYLL